MLAARLHPAGVVRGRRGPDGVETEGADPARAAAGPEQTDAGGRLDVAQALHRPRPEPGTAPPPPGEGTAARTRPAASGRMTPRGVMALQRAAGNSATAAVVAQRRDASEDGGSAPAVSSGESATSAPTAGTGTGPGPAAAGPPPAAPPEGSTATAAPAVSVPAVSVPADAVPADAVPATAPQPSRTQPVVPADSGGAGPAPATDGTVTASAGADPGPALDPGSAGGPEPTGTFADLAGERAALLEHGAQQQQAIALAARTHSEAFGRRVELAAAQVAADHDAAITAITTKAAADRRQLETGLEAGLRRADATALAELAKLDATIEDKRGDLRARATRKEQEAQLLGADEAGRAVLGSTERAQQANALGARKISQYQGAENGSDIVKGIRHEVGKVVGELNRTGQGVAGEVRRKASELAGKFRGEAADAARELNEPRARAREQILQGRDKTKEALRGMARDAVAKIDEQAGDLVGKLRNQKAANVARVREASGAMDGALGQAATAARNRLGTAAEGIAADLGAALAQAEEGAWHPQFAAQARSEITAALSSQREELAGFATRVNDSIAGTASDAGAALSAQTGELATAARQLSDDFGAGTGKLAADVGGQLGEALTEGETGMAGVAPEVAEHLGDAIDEIDGKWSEQLSENRTQIGRDVDGALGQEDRVLSELSTSIDSAAQKVSNAGFWDNLWDFVAGTFEGIVMGAWEMLKAIWSAVKTPLFWIVVAVIVVILVIAIVIVAIKLGAIGAAIVAVLAFAGKVLLVIGVIIGVAMAAWALYQMIANPNLTWRERGQLFGKAILELVLAFAGTGILKRLGVFAQLARLRRFVVLVGGVGKAIRLIRRVPDLEKLFVLVDRVKDVERLIVLLDKVGDAERLLKLLDEVGDTGRLLGLLDRVKDSALLLRLLTNAKIADVATLERLLDNAQRIKDLPGFLERLLASSKVQDAAALDALLRHPKLADAATLDRLLANAKVTDAATLERLLANAKVADAAVLDRLLANAKVTDAAALERLLANAKLDDAAALDRLLANAKVGDAAVLEALLADAKITDVALLEQLLGEAKIADAALLRRLLAETKLKDIAQLRELLLEVDTGARLERLLKLADSGEQLLAFLRRAGGAAEAANLERLLTLVEQVKGSGKAALAKKLIDQAGTPERFATLVEWAVRATSRTNPPPTLPAPPEVARFGFPGGANTQHFLDHTWEFLDIALRQNKSLGTTMWPVGTSPQSIMDALGEALVNLNPAGGPRLPVPNVAEVTTTSLGSVQVGSQTAGGGRIGQFFPTTGEHITQPVMQAFKDIFL